MTLMPQNGGRAYLPHMVILPNHHPSQTARHSFSGVFQLRLANHHFRSWPTRPISLTLTQTPLPQLTAWSQFIAGEPNRTKKGTKGEGRWVVVSLSFHRVRLGWWFDKNHPCVVNRRALKRKALEGVLQGRRRGGGGGKGITRWSRQRRILIGQAARMPQTVSVQAYHVF